MPEGLIWFSVLFLTFAPFSIGIERPTYVTTSTPSTRNMSPTKKYTTVLFDMDGVLAEVSKSYRAAIERTCHSYGATSVTQQTITEWKARGNANDDWKLSYNLIQADSNGKKDITLEQVTETFEKFYQGDGDVPGLCRLETLIPDRATLEAIRQRSQPGMGIVTGRPRRDCMTFLEQHRLSHLFDVFYCMEDGPGKPDPYPLTRACELLGIQPSKQVVFIGDTPDDVNAAMAAGCSCVGVTTPEAAAAQEENGEPHEDALISRKLKEIGADVVLPPGFVELVDML